MSKIQGFQFIAGLQTTSRSSTFSISRPWLTGIWIIGPNASSCPACNAAVAAVGSMISGASMSST